MEFSLLSSSGSLTSAVLWIHPLKCLVLLPREMHAPQVKNPSTGFVLEKLPERYSGATNCVRSQPTRPMQYVYVRLLWWWNIITYQ